MKHYFSVGRTVMPAVIVLLLLSGCISVPDSPSPRFYTLQPIKEAGSADIGDAASLDGAVVGIGPVTLPEYYSRPQIVTRKSDNTIEFAQFDRWAEPLDKSIGRVLGNNFSVLLPKLNIELFPWHGAIPIKYQVIMEVIQLECRLDGEAVLLMQWSVFDARKELLFAKRSEYRTPVGPHTYAGLVQAISVLCESASREITAALAELASKGSALIPLTKE